MILTNDKFPSSVDPRCSAASALPFNMFYFSDNKGGVRKINCHFYCLLQLALKWERANLFNTSIMFFIVSCFIICYIFLSSVYNIGLYLLAPRGGGRVLVKALFGWKTFLWAWGLGSGFLLGGLTRRPPPPGLGRPPRPPPGRGGLVLLPRGGLFRLTIPPPPLLRF